jgi:hypothetical protein
MKINIRNIFRNRRKEENVVAAKMGIITICKHCHEKIHGEDYRLHPEQDGFLTDEDSSDLWIHDKSGKSNSSGKHKHLHFAELLRID